MQYLPYKLAVLRGMLPTVPSERIEYLDWWMDNPWGGRNPQPDCVGGCGRGYVPTDDDLRALAVGDVTVSCECGARFCLTEAFRHAINRDHTPASGSLLISNVVEMATITPNVPALEAVFFRTKFERVFRVDLQVGYSVTAAEHSAVGFLGAFVALPHWIADDGFSFITVPAIADLPERCAVTYSAYGYLDGVEIALWVRRVHSARRLADEHNFDAAISMIGVATEAFQRNVPRGDSALPNGTTGTPTAPRRKKQRGEGFPSRIEAACRERGVADVIFADWRDQVWKFRDPTFHGDEISADAGLFRSALDATLALMFALRPAAMLELAGVTTP
jgi:hypothetical protein